MQTSLPVSPAVQDPARPARKPEEADAAAKEKEEARLKKACQEFEGFLLGQMITQIFQSVNKDKSGLFGHGREEEMYMGMFYEQMGSLLAKQGGIGLANQLYQQLTGEYHPAFR